MIVNANVKKLVTNFQKNKLSHAFLIETDNSNMSLNDILEFIKIINCPENFSENCSACNICHLINNKIFPNLHIINPDGQAIKKDQIENLKRDMLAIPFISKYNVYIINEAEKLNSFSANAMLKFIEEPEDNIIGFFITNNRENVINTVKSRCEILKCLYNDLETNDLKLYETNYPNIYEEAINYVKNLEDVNCSSILYNKKIIEKNYDRDDIIIMFKIILEIYNNMLNDDELIKKMPFLKSTNKREILNKINIIIDVLNKLNYNTNLNLVLDYFIIEIGV